MCMTDCVTAVSLWNHYLFTMCFSVCVCVCVCVCVWLYLCTPCAQILNILHKNTEAWVCNCMSVCTCVCVWTPSSLHWALTFMEPAGHVRAHNDPRERPSAGGGLRRFLGVWVLMEAWRREAGNCCTELSDTVCVCVCVCVCVFVCVCACLCMFIQERILAKEFC